MRQPGSLSLYGTLHERRHVAAIEPRGAIVEPGVGDEVHASVESNQPAKCQLPNGLTDNQTEANRAAFPRTLVIGGSLEALRPLMIEDCERTQELHYTGEQAAPFTNQVQVNCWGLAILDGSHKVEFMFNDGPLGHVWILVEREELSDLRRSLAKSFGEVVYETDLDAVFASGTVAVRTRPAEILVATPQLISELTGFGARQP